MVQLVLIGCWSSCKSPKQSFLLSPYFLKQRQIFLPTIVKCSADQWLTLWCLSWLCCGFYYCWRYRLVSFPLSSSGRHKYLALSTCKRNWSVGFLNLEGRRKELVLAALFFLVGALATTLAPIYSVLIIGRVTYGVGVGLVRRLIIFLSVWLLKLVFKQRHVMLFFRQCMRLQCTLQRLLQVRYVGSWYH